MGNRVRTHVNSKEKSPLPEQNSPQRRIEPTTLHQAEQCIQHTTNELSAPLTECSISTTTTPAAITTTVIKPTSSTTSTLINKPDNVTMNSCHLATASFLFVRVCVNHYVINILFDAKQATIAHTRLTAVYLVSLLTSRRASVSTNSPFTRPLQRRTARAASRRLVTLGMQLAGRLSPLTFRLQRAAFPLSHVTFFWCFFFKSSWLAVPQVLRYLDIS